MSKVIITNIEGCIGINNNVINIVVQLLKKTQHVVQESDKLCVFSAFRKVSDREENTFITSDEKLLIVVLATEMERKQQEQILSKGWREGNVNILCTSIFNRNILEGYDIVEYKGYDCSVDNIKAEIERLMAQEIIDKMIEYK